MNSEIIWFIVAKLLQVAAEGHDAGYWDRSGKWVPTPDGKKKDDKQYDEKQPNGGAFN